MHGQRAGLLLWLVALAPLPFGSNRPWAWSLAALVVAILLVRHGIDDLRSGRPLAVPPLRLAGPLVLVIAVLAWIGVQLVPGLAHGVALTFWSLPERLLGEPAWRSISIAPDLTVVALMRLLAYCGVFWLALQSFGTSARADDAMFALSVIVAAYAVYGLAMTFSGLELILWYPKWSYQGDVTATFVNRNSFATFVGLGLLCSLSVLVRALGGRGPDARSYGWSDWLLGALPARVYASVAIVPICVVALLLSHSRAGATASLLAALVFLAGATWRLGQRRTVGVGLLALLLGLVALYGLLGGGRLVERSMELLDPQMVESRFPAFSGTLAAIADAPLTGFGYGTFEDAFKPYRRPPLGLDLHFDKAHSTWLETALELGLPAALLWFTAIGWLVLRCAAGLRRRGTRFAPSWAAACAGLLVGLHAAVDFSIQIPSVAFLFAVLLGLGVGQSWRREAEHGKAPAARAKHVAARSGPLAEGVLLRQRP